MTVGMLAGEHVDIFRERTKVGVVFEKTLGELPVAGASSALVSEIEVLRQSVGLVPGPRDVLVGTGSHLFAIQGLRREERQDCVSGPIEDCQSLWIVGELVGIDEAAVGFVEGIGRDAIVAVELLANGGREGRDETLHLRLSWLVAGDGVGARKAGEPLAEGVAGNVPGHILRRIEERRRRIPAAEVFTGSGLAGELAGRLKHAVLVEVEEESMVLLKLHEHPSLEELHIFVVELSKRCRSHSLRGGSGESMHVAENRASGCEGCGALEKGSTGWSGHCGIL